MSLLHIKNGTVYDPANGILGKKQDIWIEQGQIIAAPGQSRKPNRTIDAVGQIIMPGGIDMHCHITGPKVNSARIMNPEMATHAPPIKRTAHTRSGTTGMVPSSFATGYLFAGMGYTTAIDAAIPGLLARQAHEEFADTPILDKGFLTLFGNNRYVLKLIQEGRKEAVRSYAAWALDAVKGFGIKIVNPGGVENWKQISRKTIRQLDEPVGEFGVTPRQIVRELADVADSLQLPHPVHIHCNNLGMPGNWETTLKTMEALEGRRGHFAHVQFNSYAGDENDGASFASGVEKILEYVRTHPNITVDVGHVTPGESLSITGDAPFSEHLARLTKGKWFTSDSEQESSCGIIPGEYRPYKSLIHAVQWAIGLEWYLRMDDPWRIAMSSDHPNGGAFIKYPEIIALLMDNTRRQEMLKKMPVELQERTNLAQIDREYSLSEIAIITRAAPARILGLKDKGHLGVGADADVTIYSPQSDVKEMFQRPRWVVKSGELVATDGEIANNQIGQTIYFESKQFDRDAISDLKPWFNENYSTSFYNYTIDAEEIPNELVTANKSDEV